MADSVWSFPGGKPVTDIDSITLVNNTLLSHKITVPADRVWRLLTVKAVNGDDVTRTTKISIYNEVALTSLITILSYKADLGAGSTLTYPNSITGSEGYIARPTLIILTAGQTIEINFAAGGASTGAVDADGVVITYLEMPA